MKYLRFSVMIAAVMAVLCVASCGRDQKHINESVVVERYSDSTACTIWKYDSLGVAFWEMRLHEGGKGVMAEGPLKNGMRDGHWKGYFPTGELMSEGRFVNGKREGEGKIYFKSGVVSQINHYHEGKPCGIWTYFADDESHTVVNVRDYDALNAERAKTKEAQQ